MFKIILLLLSLSSISFSFTPAQHQKFCESIIPIFKANVIDGDISLFLHKNIDLIKSASTSQNYSNLSIDTLMEKARIRWMVGLPESTAVYLGYCCRNIQDSCFPNVDTKFELDCEKQYATGEYVKPKIICSLAEEKAVILKERKEISKLCDKKGSEWITKYLNWITFVFSFLKEDYDEAVRRTNLLAERSTVSLMYTFFIQLTIY